MNYLVLIATCLFAIFKASGAHAAPADLDEHFDGLALRLPYHYDSVVLFPNAKTPGRKPGFVPYVAKEKNCLDSDGAPPDNEGLVVLEPKGSCFHYIHQVETPKGPKTIANVTFCPGDLIRWNKREFVVEAAYPYCLDFSNRPEYPGLEQLSPLIVLKDKRDQKEYLSTAWQLQRLKQALETNNVVADGDCTVTGLSGSGLSHCAEEQALKNATQQCKVVGGRPVPSSAKLLKTGKGFASGPSFSPDFYRATATIDCLGLSETQATPDKNIPVKSADPTGDIQ